MARGVYTRSELEKVRLEAQLDPVRFKKGNIPWNKGLKGFLAGEKHYNWKGKFGNKDHRERVKFHDTVQKMVFERDNYTCQMCGVRGVALQVDHIQPWAEYVELRFDINNCRTLCQKCHYKVTFGKEMSKEVKTWGHNLKLIERMVD